MTEHLRHVDSGETLPNHDLSEQIEHARKAAHEAAKHGEHPSVEHARKAVHEQAISGRDYAHGEREAAPATHTFGAHKELKAHSYKQTLAHIRSRLSWSEKSFSKHIHSKRAEKIDATLARSVARPWGLLCAGLAAFIGSLVVIINASHYGFRYNFGVFTVLFFGGYIVGTLLEAAGKILKRNQS